MSKIKMIEYIETEVPHRKVNYLRVVFYGAVLAVAVWVIFFLTGLATL